MSSTEERIIVDQKEYTDLIKDKHYLMGRVEELEKQVKMLENMLIQK